ncbi:hypothetical protein PG991_014604 [Apiospora marii]|uniref:Uncharacterized protein n=1 Tax=Apiospora marii TaxID=335849 RepID=A0ABR1R5U9_9PEZI
MPNQTRSGWNFDGNGRAYWQDEAGRHIHVRPKDFEHDPHFIDGASTQPEVVTKQYRPFPGAKVSTWPKRSEPSYLSEKLAAGRNRPYFGDGASQHSGRPDVDAPAGKRDVAGVTRPNASTDIYRDAKQAWGKKGPTTSTYDKQYYEYKGQESEKTRLQQEYKDFVGAPKPPLAEIHRNKDRYGGYPMQTQQWHQEAAQKAAIASKAAADFKLKLIVPGNRRRH